MDLRGLAAVHLGPAHHVLDGELELCLLREQQGGDNGETEDRGPMTKDQRPRTDDRRHGMASVEGRTSHFS
jgi:hypothetical protein